ncbi:uncharacterized protein LOC130550325 [Triplophysa rosa]|uniref:uncharacterized protein LOC130550325 n=1 Tax=Triplophysa rosa TaxID=992332 RepID=UPI0025462820|nr:uncharacterized protein LOC130550325 [Triplophysa rosa]
MVQLYTITVLLLQISGGWGSRKLTIVAPADCGYTGRLVKATKIGENSVFYIAPLQDELDTSPLPPSSETFRNMPKAVCKKCNRSYPVQVLTSHVKSCPDVVTLDDDEEAQDEAQDEEREYSDNNEVMKNEQAVCPICQDKMPLDILEVHASECGERTIDNTMNDTTELTFMDNEIKNSTQVTYLNDGLRRAFVHVLFHGSSDTATLQLEDCPDIDVRETISFLNGQVPLTEDQYSKVLELCLAWDLPGPTEENRRWLYERLLSHAVLGRRTRQMKQIKQGLKDTFVWPLLTDRKDVVLFPKESEDLCTPEMLLSCIAWPNKSNNDDDDDDDEYPAATKERIAGFLKQFIESGSSKDLKNLLRFWVGWERTEKNMAVEIVKSDLPRSSTCFCILRLPGHYTEFHSFSKDLIMCIGVCKYGFGLV